MRHATGWAAVSEARLPFLALLAVGAASPQGAQAQSLPPIVDPGPPVPDTPPSCGASRADPFGGNFCVGGTTVTNTFRDALVFLPPIVTTVRQQNFVTRVLARLEGGTPLFDESFRLPFADPAVQAGVARARAAVTTAGGPGIVVLGPTLVTRTTSTRTVSASTYSLAGFEERVETTTTIGAVTAPVVDYPGTRFARASIIAIGDRTSCGAAVDALRAAGTSSVRPSCGPVPEGDIRGVPQGSTNVDNGIVVEYRIAENRTDTTIETLLETYELTGRVVPVGTIHAAVQSGIYDLAGRLLGRMPEMPAGLWGEPYYMHVAHGNGRDTWGLAGGYALEAGPGVTLGFAVDHGESKLRVPGALETGALRLTELAATARLRRGPLLAALSGVYGLGSVDTTRAIVGSSRASYDVRLAGAALDVGYTVAAGAVSITPRAGLDYVSVRSEGFAESDTLGLIVPGHRADRLRATAGLAVGVKAGPVTLSASARYVKVISGAQRGLPVAFAVAPATPLLMTGPAEPDTAQLGARARLPLAANAALTLGYDGGFGDGYTQHAGFAAFNLSW